MEMCFEEFKQEIKEELSKSLPGYEFSEQSIEKLQKESYNALVIREAGSNIALTINVDELYELFNDGKEISAIISSTIDVVQNADRPTNVEELADYKRMRDKLLLQIIPVDGNEEILSKVPHKTIDDMAVVYRFLIRCENKGESSILLTNENLKVFGITEKQLEADANEVCEMNHPMSIRSLESVLFGIPEEEASRQGLWVVTNDIGRYGAAVIAYPNALDKIAEKLGSSFYLIPSSIHEMLAIPDSTEISAEGIDAMICEVNSNEVSPKERLTNHSYHYDMDTRLFERSTVYEERKGGAA